MSRIWLIVLEVVAVVGVWFGSGCFIVCLGNGTTWEVRFNLGAVAWFSNSNPGHSTGVPFTSGLQVLFGYELPPLRACWRRMGSLLDVVFPTWPLYTIVAVTAAWRVLRRGPKRGHCARCGYNLTGNASGTCPECGWPLERKMKRSSENLR